MNNQELAAEVARLNAENAQLKANEARKAVSGGIKVSAKGAVSVYGLGRFPVTLYRSQWESLLGMAPKITAFIEANKASLKEKE